MTYVLSNPTFERHEKAVDLVLGRRPSERAGKYDGTKIRQEGAVHQWVFVTGPAQGEFYPAKLQWRDEAAPPAERWKDFDPNVIVWAVGNNAEVLEQNKRYHANLISLHPGDFNAVYSCTVGGGGQETRTGVARVTITRIDGYYVSRLGTGTFNTATKTFSSGRDILVLDAAEATIP